MVKRVILILGILVVLFAGVNTAAALSSSVLDAISGLPLSDQILYIAKEVDRLKLKDELRDACDKADSFLVGGYFKFENYNFHSVEQAGEMIPGLVSGWNTDERMAKFITMRDQYNQASGDCDRFTEEFNQKYGN